ncbi:MAG TPA: single-stranded DNA-binding protein [Firmicutes bacterium]|jgi:single-strand DNA-binding protein|nr:single-stranded DNA-binding protein [Bacillota bacterium]HAW70110.1 single-stranded DNA-binding protein [Bacillota bacterium]HAZ21003.1 single-stranded DNA-binding protein [Bacillota bacterium]HBE06948.1 single-stranded DNA-binding protein [Bacillota bacterium]HBG44542.1 single-stranded DNA-binding protein [Bacillota bacterium]
MLNRIVLVGRLTRDPELRYTPNGVPVANFTLAVDRSYTNQQGERQTDFIDIVVWRKLAELCGQYLGKGRLVALEGRLQIRSYETQEGQKRKVAEVVADNIRFLDKGRGDDRSGGGQEHVSDDGDQGRDEDDLGSMSLDDLPF